MTEQPRLVQKEKQLTHFAYEVGTLRFVQRDFITCGFNTASNVAEHTFRVAMLAWLIAEKEGADTARVTQMALVHDLPEIRTLDHGLIHSFYAIEREEAAAQDQLKPVLPSAFERWKEYESRESLESRIVKDADHLEVALEVQEFRARGATMPRNIDEYLTLLEDILVTDTARALLKEILATGPMEWHDLFADHKHAALRAKTNYKLKAA